MRITDRTVNNRPRLRQREEKWINISDVPIAPNDLVRIYNESLETKRTFQVQDVKDNGDSTARIISAILVDTTDPNELIGTPVDFTLPRAETILGAVIKVDERFERLTGVETNDLMAVELYKWLMARSMYNYGAEFRKCVEFLKGCGFIPRGEDYQLSQNRVRAMMRQRGEMFRSSGGKIFGTGVDLSSGLQGKSIEGKGLVVPIRRVKLGKLYMGIRLILESGVLGEMILED